MVQLNPGALIMRNGWILTFNLFHLFKSLIALPTLDLLILEIVLLFKTPEFNLFLLANRVSIFFSSPMLLRWTPFPLLRVHFLSMFGFALTVVLRFQGKHLYFRKTILLQIPQFLAFQ